MIKIKGKGIDGKEQGEGEVSIGCFNSIWKLGLVLIVVFNFGRILDFVERIMGVCR